MGQCNTCQSSRGGQFEASGEEPAFLRQRSPVVALLESALNIKSTPTLADEDTDQPDDFPSAYGTNGSNLGSSQGKNSSALCSSVKAAQLEKVLTHEGFFAALDQSVNVDKRVSTRVSIMYGIDTEHMPTDEEVTQKVQGLRSRIMTHPKFDSRVIGCVITEKQMEVTINRMSTPQFLWVSKNVVPVLRAPFDLQVEQNGVELMAADMAAVEEKCIKAAENFVFAMKVRAVIKMPNAVGIKQLIDQLFQACHLISEKGMIPFCQPEIDINAEEKIKCEQVLIDVLIDALDNYTDTKVALVLTVPTKSNLYLPVIRHPNILRVSGISGGYERDTACKMLAQNVGMVANFARALSEDLYAGQGDDDFGRNLDATCQMLLEASLSVEDQVEKMARVAEQAGFFIALTSRGVLPLLSENDKKDSGKVDSHLENCVKRIVSCDKLNSSRVLGVVLTKEYCEMDVNGMPATQYLWSAKGLIPFMILSTVLEAEKDGVQLAELPLKWHETLETAVKIGVFGVQVRGLIKQPSKSGIDAIVSQQFEVAHSMLLKGLLPMLLLEVDINCEKRRECEEILMNAILGALGNLKQDEQVVLVLAMPTKSNLYLPLMAHPNVVRVGSPSGGYSCADTCRMLCDNDGLIGVFGRGFTERLKADMDDGEFATCLADTCKVIHSATVAVSAKEEQMSKVNNQDGFFAIMDNSGAAVAKALKRYGVKEQDEEHDNKKFHQMLTRIVTSDHFSGTRVIGTVISERSMQSSICGLPTAKYLWSQKGTVPFLKIDNGLNPEKNGVQLMNFQDTDVAALKDTLDRAGALGIFGTKQRSFIRLPNRSGITAVVDQQLEMARHVCSKGLLPILQPEVDINAANKAACEQILLDTLIDGIEKLRADEKVVLLLTLPSRPNLYCPLMGHPNIVRLVALSGGYSQKKSCKMLSGNVNMIAGFGRAFMEGLNVKNKDSEFAQILDRSCSMISEVSRNASVREEQLIKLNTQSGFFVGFDQDATSMPKLLASYGISSKMYDNTEEAVLEKAHELHSRIMKNPQFNGSRCIGIILTETSLTLNIGRLPTAKFVWEFARIVPFMKLDKGLAEEADGVCLFKEIRHVSSKLDKAARSGCVGTITRSLIRANSAAGVRSIVGQQMKMAKTVLKAGLIPIIQIEVAIDCPDKAKCERLLLTALLRALEELSAEQRVILDLTLPSQAGTYSELVKHAQVIRVAALSGGYTQKEAVKLLEDNPGVIASFGRAFAETLHVTQTERQFTTEIVKVCKLLYNAGRALEPPVSARSSVNSGTGVVRNESKSSVKTARSEASMGA